MDNLVYSASPLKAFSGSLVLLAFLFGLGGLGLISAVFSRRQRMLPRVIQGLVSLFLVLVGLASAYVTYNSFQNGDKTVLVRLEEKNIVKRNCDRATPCIDYVAETTDGQKYYVFGVTEEVWNKLEEQACYQFTYYPAKPLLGDVVQQDAQYEAMYETTGAISRIERVRCS